jgi:uncharacterized coiled-coil DUF342 family protein
MDATYKALQKQADKLRYRMQDMVDSADEAGRKLMHESREVMEDIESNKPPRSIEARIRQLQQHLENCKAKPTASISPRDADTMVDDYEDLRRDVRAHPKY